MSRQLLLVISGATLLAIACGDDAPGEADGGVARDAAPSADADQSECLGDERRSLRVYFGTELPTYVPLVPGQLVAIGSWGDCTGTLVAPTWVLTAKHCGVSTSSDFCMGEEPGSPNVCFDVVQAVDHPDWDLTLAELERDARELLPGVRWIPIMTEVMDDSWVGATAEAAGYGLQEDGSDGEREFTAEPIIGLDEELITIDGEGNHGVCYGDSGGPVMVIATDTTVRVAGALSWGDPSCVGEDNYTRVDNRVPWVESYTGPTMVDDGPTPCGTITTQGRCAAGGTAAMWCGEDSTFQYETCADGDSCGWDETAGGYRCISGADPCGGVDEYGECDGLVAKWCEDGDPKQRDCGSCEQKCVTSIELGGAYCAPDPCMGLDYLGRCNGNVAEWCSDGQFESVDCTEYGETCQYIDETVGYYCT